MKNLLLVFLFYSTFTAAHCQNLPGLCSQSKESMIICSLSLSQSGFQTAFQDTLLIRNMLVLEPISLQESKTSDKENEQTPMVSHKLKWYYLTNLLDLTGLAFDRESQNDSKVIRAYDKQSKGVSFAFSKEPFISKETYSLEDYKKVADTIIEGQTCFVIMANRNVHVSYNSTEDELLYTKMIVNPKIHDQTYDFISKAISKKFGGAITAVASKYKSGLSLSTSYRYSFGFVTKDKVIFDQFESLYLANLSLLEKYKTNKPSSEL